MINEGESTRRRKRRLQDVPKPVVGRWARLSRRRWANAVARAFVRQKLLWTERKRQRLLAQTLETFRYGSVRHGTGKFQGMYVLYNIGLYLLIADRDIQAVKRDALTHPDEWTRKLNARIILLTIYEWDADKVSGRALKDALDIMLVPDEVKVEAIQVLRKLRLIQRKVRTNFAVVRNSTIAHRDPDALAQYRAIHQLSEADVIAIAIEFFAAVGEFISVHTKIMAVGASPRSLLRQWAETERRDAAAP